MRKFILNIIGFSVFFVLIYTICITIFGKFIPSELRPNLKSIESDYGSTYYTLSEVKSKSSVDILVIGASDAYRTYDPRIFSAEGFKIFNLGTSSQTPLETSLLLDRYLKQLNPKLVIYEVSPVCLTLDGIESALDLILNKVNSKIATKLLFDNPDILLINSFFYSKISGIIFSKEAKGQFSTPKERYIPGGFVETVLKFNTKTRIDTIQWKPVKKQLEKFIEICTLLKEKKISYILVNANNIIDRQYGNNNIIDSFFRSQGEYFNINKELILDDSLHFIDNSHLNQDGVKLFDNYLITHKIK